MQNKKQDIEVHRKALLAIWAVLLILQLLLLLMVFFAKPELFDFDLSGPIGGTNPVFNFALLVLAVFCFTISLIMRFFLIRIATRDGVRPLLYVTLIVGVTMCEAVTLWGVLSAFHSSYPYFFVFFALGILGTLLHYPKRADLNAASFKQP